MNARFEAGHHRPPQQPREIPSRISATSSRERFSSTVIYESTENFRTGPEGLFAAVRGELARTVHYLPHVLLPHDPNQIVTVAIASNNNKKVDSILEHIPQHRLNVIRIPEAEETHTKDVIIDATSKAIDAARIIQTSEDSMRREIRFRPHVTMANDQVNAIPIITEHPVTHMPVVTFERLGKPQSEEAIDPIESIRQTFQKLSDLAQENHWPTIPYLIELATVIHNPADPNNNAVNLQKSAVFLSPEGMHHLATDRFDEYIERVKEQVARTNGKIDATGIAGGLELQVLDDMGTVQFISGTGQEIQTAGFPPQQRPEAKDHAYRLALGAADERLIREYFVESGN